MLSLKKKNFFFAFLGVKAGENFGFFGASGKETSPGPRPSGTWAGTQHGGPGRGREGASLCRGHPGIIA